MDDAEFDALSKLMSAPMTVPGPKVETTSDGGYPVPIHSEAPRVNMTGDTDAWVKAKNQDSVLRRSVAKSGKNSYYYAHATPLGDEEFRPELLSSGARVEARSTVPCQDIQKYAVMDTKIAIKLYVEMESVGQGPEVTCEFLRTHCELMIRNHGGCDHRLTYYYTGVDASQCKLVLKPNKIIVTLRKKPPEPDVSDTSISEPAHYLVRLVAPGYLRKALQRTLCAPATQQTVPAAAAEQPLEDPPAAVVSEETVSEKEDPGDGQQEEAGACAVCGCCECPGREGWFRHIVLAPRCPVLQDYQLAAPTIAKMEVQQHRRNIRSKCFIETAQHLECTEPTTLPSCLVRQVRAKYPSLHDTYEDYANGNVLVPGVLQPAERAQVQRKPGRVGRRRGNPHAIRKGFLG